MTSQPAPNGEGLHHQDVNERTPPRGRKQRRQILDLTVLMLCLLLFSKKETSFFGWASFLPSVSRLQRGSPQWQRCLTASQAVTFHSSSPKTTSDHSNSLSSLNLLLCLMVPKVTTAIHMQTFSFCLQNIVDGIVSQATICSGKNLPLAELPKWWEILQGHHSLAVEPSGNFSLIDFNIIPMKYYGLQDA